MAGSRRGGVLVDLDGVAAAEGDVGAAFAGEVGEDALVADGAVGVGVLVLISCAVGPEVEGEEGAAHGWGWWVRSLRASVAWREAARLTAVERMPAVSQVSTVPVGGLGKMQARQAVGGMVGYGAEVRRRFASSDHFAAG